jgi:hypothetical protein
MTDKKLLINVLAFLHIILSLNIRPFSKIMEIKKVDNGIKFVDNWYYFYNFIFNVFIKDCI